MAGKYEIGLIPRFSVWSGETLSFKVTSKFGNAARFSKRATPSPSGPMTIDAVTGEFKFTPAPNDKDEITVWLTTQGGAQEEKQKVYITPLPKIASDYNIISNSAQPPEPESKKYIQVSEEDLGKAIFNNTANYTDAKQVEINVKRVSVSGVRVIFQQGNKLYPLYDTYNGNTDIKGLDIYADEVIVRSPLKLPGTTVSIYARSLKFEDCGKDAASIDTTPLTVEVRSLKDEGIKGASAGNIYLYVKNVEMPGRTNRFIAKGCRGQAGRLGEQGAKGSDVSAWDKECTTDTWWAGSETLSWKRLLPDGKKDGYTPVYAEIWEYYAPGAGGPWRHVQNRGQKSWPGDGSGPKIFPGRPGQGGDGGTICTSFIEDVKGRKDLESGKPGEMAKTVPGSVAGEPIKACWVKAEYKKWGIPSSDSREEGDGILNRVTGLSIIEKHESKPAAGAEAPGPNSATPKGNDGTVQPLKAGEDKLWIHPRTIRAVLQYARDAFLAGHGEIGNKLVEPYLSALKDLDLKKTSFALELTSQYSEIDGLVQRINGPYDYFGNPAGWVPMLSFESNLKLYQAESKSAIKMIFLCYWIEKNQTKDAEAAGVMKNAINRLDEERKQAIDTFNSAQTELVKLDSEFEDILSRIKDLKRDLVAKEKDIKEDIAISKKGEQILRASLNMLGGIMQIIPAGQPALGAVGKGLTVVSDMDFSEPLDSAGDMAGAFTELAKVKLAPKVKSLFEKLSTSSKETKKDADAEAFDKEYTKKKIEQEVKEKLDEQKAVKDQISKALSSFSVPKDEIDKEFERIKTEHPILKDLTEKISALGQKQSVFAEKLKTVVETLDEACAAIINNQLAVVEIRSQYKSKMNRLNQEALQHVQAMGQRARNRLVKYQYYLVKSYNYLMVDSLNGVNYNAEYLVDAFADMLASSKDGLLTADQYDKLAGVFEDQLKSIVGRIIEWYQSHPVKTGTKFLVSLSPEQLSVLNGPTKKVTVNLMEMGYLDFTQEDIRITDIKTHQQVQVIDPPNDQAVNVNLTYKHSGESIIRRGGGLFLFRTGSYAIDPETGDKKSAPYRDEHMFWGATVSYTKGEKSITGMQPDPADESLLRHLLDGKSGEKGKWMLNYQPSTWADITIQRSVTPQRFAGKIDNLVLEVSYVFHAVSDELRTLYVRIPGDLKPFIKCDKEDANGRTDGYGSFLRTYPAKSVSKVTLTAPARFGALTFAGWRMEDQPGPNKKGVVEPFSESPIKATDAPDRLKGLVKERELVVKIADNPIVEAIYLHSEEEADDK